MSKTGTTGMETSSSNTQRSAKDKKMRFTADDFMSDQYSRADKLAAYDYVKKLKEKYSKDKEDMLASTGKLTTSLEKNLRYSNAAVEAAEMVLNIQPRTTEKTEADETDEEGYDSEPDIEAPATAVPMTEAEKAAQSKQKRAFDAKINEAIKVRGGDKNAEKSKLALAALDKMKVAAENAKVFKVDLAGTSDADLYKIFIDFLSGQMGAMKEILDAMAYDGFSPQEYIKQFVLKGIQRGRDPSQVLSDMTTLILYGLQQGTNINARYAMKTVSLEMTRMLLYIVNTYDIKDGVESTTGRVQIGTTSASTLTIGRTLAAVPQISTLIMRTGKVRTLYATKSLPIEYQHLNGAAVIPSDNTDLFNAFVDWATQATLVISRKNKKYAGKDITEVRSETEEWAKIARASTAVTEDQRNAILFEIDPTKVSFSGMTALKKLDPTKYN